MNQKKAKWLRKLVSTKNPVLLLLIRNKFGEATQSMDYGKLYKTAKKLYKSGEIQKIKNWPTIKQLRLMKGKELFDEPLIKPAEST